MDIRALAEKYEDYIIEKRRYFHKHPELSWKEFHTTDVLEEELKAMGLEPHRFDGITGLYAYIRGSKPGKTVLLRSDIDALPIEEKTGLPFASENPGVMHACGHDNHMAMLLGACKVLNDIKDELAGNVKIFFQAAEETGYGAVSFVEQQLLDDVDACYGMHIWGEYDSPFMAFPPKNCMAGGTLFDLTVEGVTAHASTPHKGVDAVLVASHIIIQLQSYISSRNNALNPLVITFGKINGGSRFNILANKVELNGSIRNFSRELDKHMETDLRRIVNNTADSFGASVDMSYRAVCPAVINDNKLVSIARNAAERLYGADSLVEIEPLMGSEDFAHLSSRVPSVFGFLGSKNKSLGFVYSNHHEKYTVDESALTRGTAMYAQFAVDYLNS